jgi:methylenetetrahydrofolate dehydrogenase (NADP+)/methenyltetrahydrofolate cyclohydrolase
LADVLVGDDEAALAYRALIAKACDACGIAYEGYELPAGARPAGLFALLKKLNRRRAVDGVLVHRPLPPHLNERALSMFISPDKDVDGMHPLNMGQLLAGAPNLVPATARAVMHLIRESGAKLTGSRVVVVGRSNVVGKPVAMLLLQAHATVTMAHSKTLGLSSVTRGADILVVAAGRAGLIGSRHVRRGAIVVDVGINEVDGRLVGDVDFESVAPLVAAITPVPGGVGPVTIAALLENTLQAARQRAGLC